MPESFDTPNESFPKPAAIGEVDKDMVVHARVQCDQRQPTMSSRDIAELTGREHDNVRRDIRNLAEALSLTFEEKSEASTGGRPSKVYLVPKRESLILVSGYNIVMRAAIIDRWQELELPAPAVVPILALNDPTTLRALLLNNVEERMKLAQELAAAGPKLEAFERIASAEGSLCITDAAKSLQIRPKSLFDFLRAHRWIYQPHGGRGDIAYATKLQQGLMEHKTTTVHRSDGSEKIITQARITPKGLTRLAQEFPSPVKLAA